jgi:putative hydrolase of the HAD superfamily
LAEEELARIALERGDHATYTVRLRTACNILETIGHQRSQSLAAELGALREAPIPRPRGILFDLVDTLAVTRASEYESAKRSISKQLGVDHERFTAAWAASRKRASTDPNWTPADRIQWVASELGVTIAAADLAELAHGEVQLWSSSVSLRPGVTEALDEIRSLGIRLVLVSNGSSAMRGLPELLGLGPYLDGSLLSADARVLKPDPAIYRRALEIINLPPDKCLYVGDGNDRELEGAMAAGIFAVRVMPGEIPAYDSSESLDWDATVSCVEELVTLIRRDA